MKLQLLASAALMLLSAVPGVFSEEPSAALARPFESFAGVIDAITDEVDLYDDEQFDAEDLSKGSEDDKKKKKKKKSSRSSYKKKKSSYKKKNRKGMCGRNMRSGDKKTCRQLEKRFCDKSKDRKKNRKVCDELGFPKSASQDAITPEEEYSEDTLDEIEEIVEEIEDELEEDEESTLDSQDSSFPSEDYDELEDEDYWTSDDRRDRRRRSGARYRSDRRRWTRSADRARRNRWRGRSFDRRRYSRCARRDRWCDDDGNELSVEEAEKLDLRARSASPYDWDDANDRPTRDYRDRRDDRRERRDNREEYRNQPWKRSADRARRNRWEGRSFEDDSDDCYYYGDC